MARILILHGDELVRLHATRVLEGEGYEVIAVPDGLEGLSAVERSRPNVIVSDIGLPRLDGVTLIRALAGREDTRDIPVVFLFAVADPEVMLCSLAAGGRYFLTVPFEEEELAFKIRRIVKP